MADRTVIVCYDGREPGRDAILLAGMLARRPGHRLLVACVYENDELRDVAEDIAFEATNHIPYGVRYDMRALPARSVDRALAELAAAEEAELIVLGSSERGTAGTVLVGDVAERLMRLSPCVLTIAPRGYYDHTHKLRTIGVAFDGSAESWLALERASELAQGLGAALRLIAVIDPARVGYGSMISAFTYGNLSGVRREELEESIAEARESVPGGVETSHAILLGSPADCLIEEADRGVDLLFSGCRGLGALRRTLQGGVSSALMRGAGCPVCVVPRSAGASERAAA